MVFGKVAVVIDFHLGKTADGYEPRFTVIQLILPLRIVPVPVLHA